MITTSALLAFADDKVSNATDAVGAHFLLDDGHAYALAPDIELLDGSSAECVGSTEIHLFAVLLELVCQLADGGGFAHTVYANNHYDVWRVGQSRFERHGLGSIVFCQQAANLLLQHLVQLVGPDVFVAVYALLYLGNHAGSGFDTDVGSYKHLLQIVENLVVYLALADNGASQFRKNILFCFLKTLIEGLLFLFSKETEQSHNISVLITNHRYRRMTTHPQITRSEHSASESNLPRHNTTQNYCLFLVKTNILVPLLRI